MSRRLVAALPLVALVSCAEASTDMRDTPAEPAGAHGSDVGGATADADDGGGESPQVTSIVPSRGRPGAPVTLRGSGLAGAVVRFGPATAARVRDSQELIVRTVPALAPGTVPIRVGEHVVGEFEIVASQAMAVTSVEPMHGVVGDEILFGGSHLHGAEVKFGSTRAEVVSDSAERIVRRVPELPPGTVPIVVGGVETGLFLVLAVVVDGFSPNSGVVGSEVTLQGRGLAGKEVLLGGDPASVLVESATELVIRVPDRSLGLAKLTVDGIEAGDFETLGPRITRVCPNRNPAGGPLQILGEGLEALQELQVGSATFTPDQYQLRSDGSIVLTVPVLPEGISEIRAVGGSGAPPPAFVEVLADYPSDVPASPPNIVLPLVPRTAYIPPVGRSWKNHENDEHWLRLGGDDACAAVLNSGQVSGTEELDGNEHVVTGTYDKAANSLVLEVHRGASVETYRGQWLDQGYSGIANYHQLLLTSDSECRQVLMEVDTTGLCVD